MLKAGPEWARENRRAEIAESLLVRFLDAWNMGEDPTIEDIQAAREIKDAAAIALKDKP